MICAETEFARMLKKLLLDKYADAEPNFQSISVYMSRSSKVTVRACMEACSYFNEHI